MRLIDADELKKKVNFQKDDFPCEKEDEFWNWAIDSIIEIIDNAPTVEQFDDTELQRAVGYSDGYLKGKEERPNDERPQGKWIEKVERRGCFAGDKTVYSYTCPFCGAKEFKKYPFCHCGADMRGGRE